jgi:small subunit ribosomal protein S4e
MLKKLGGIFAPKPSTGPHKSRQCVPLIMILRDRLKYALNGQDVKSILMHRLVKIDGKVRSDPTYPVGFQDILSIERSGEHFRMLMDPKGRFGLLNVNASEANYKLCRVRKILTVKSGVSVAISHDARSIYSKIGSKHSVEVNDTVIFDMANKFVDGTLKFQTNNLAIVTRGHNAGRIGMIVHIQKHQGTYTVTVMRDAVGKFLVTRRENVFVIGKNNLPKISLFASKGVRRTVLYEQSKQKLMRHN